MKNSPIEVIYGGSSDSFYLDDQITPSRELYDSFDARDAIPQSQVSMAYSNNFDNMLPGQSARVGFTRDNYEYYRPEESLPKKYKDIIHAIDKTYIGLPIVRNILDLMSDFASEGIKIVHPVKAVEKFYQDWFDKVNAVDRSERFLSGLYRHGMVVVQHLHGKVKYKTLPNFSLANEVNLIRDKFPKNEIPLIYNFVHPALFSHENYHDLTSPPIYKVKKPTQLYSESVFRNYTASTSKNDEVAISPDRLYVSYYKKDDWTPKPIPYLFPVVKHAIMLDKLWLADSAALDGAISKLRIIKLGDLEKGLFPNKTNIATLDRILRASTPGGTKDIIWGPDISIIESNTDIHKFLGQEKYVPHITQVYEGLGIPSSFVGSGQGTTNNYISLKILTRRLMSGRERLIDFWESQIKIVQKAMGFAEPATLEFNHLDLGDEESERNLLIQLLDRNIVSEERVLNLLGFDPRMENKRVQKETKERKGGRRVAKTGQFHNGDPEFTLTKVALEKGFWGPEQAGIEPKEGTDSIPTPQDRMLKSKDSGVPSNPNIKGGAGGRPRGAKDSTKRKTPAFSPKIKASLDLWTCQAQNQIHDILKAYYLEILNKKTLRELSLADIRNFELVKFGVLFNIAPHSEVDESLVVAKLGAFAQASEVLPKEVKEEYENDKVQFKITFKRSPSPEEEKLIQRSIYINYQETIQTEETEDDE